MPVWGYPTDYGDTLKILSKNNIPLIEDAAQAHGTIIENKFAGTHGLLGCFSTHDRKLLSTGEGGFILTNDESLANNMRQFCQLGYMDGIHYGKNYKLNTFAAALGIYRLDYINHQLKVRRDNVRKFFSNLHSDRLVELPYDKKVSSPNYYVLVVKLKDKVPERNDIFIKLLAEQGLHSDAIKYGYRPLYDRPLLN